jgi:catechol 2,3-dioxygenase-like lactoylglutathione lyase family enzyme
MSKFQATIPILNVKNIAASMDYYVNKLGFEKKWDWGEPVNFGCWTRQGRDLSLPGRPGTARDVDFHLC